MPVVHEPDECRQCGGARGRLLGHLTDSNPPPIWVDCFKCKGTGKEPETRHDTPNARESE